MSLRRGVQTPQVGAAVQPSRSHVKREAIQANIKRLGELLKEADEVTTNPWMARRMAEWDSLLRKAAAGGGGGAEVDALKQTIQNLLDGKQKQEDKIKKLQEEIEQLRNELGAALNGGFASYGDKKLIARLDADSLINNTEAAECEMQTLSETLAGAGGVLRSIAADGDSVAPLANEMDRLVSQMKANVARSRSATVLAFGLCADGQVDSLALVNRRMLRVVQSLCMLEASK